MTRMQIFRRVRAKNDETSELQDSIIDSLNELTATPFLIGKMIEVNLLSASTNLVEHKLNAKPEGYIIVDKDALAIVYRDPTETDLLDKFLYLKTDMDVNVKLWVF